MFRDDDITLRNVSIMQHWLFMELHTCTCVHLIGPVISRNMTPPPKSCSYYYKQLLKTAPTCTTYTCIDTCTYVCMILYEAVYLIWFYEWSAVLLQEVLVVVRIPFMLWMFQDEWVSCVSCGVWSGSSSLPLFLSPWPLQLSLAPWRLEVSACCVHCLPRSSHLQWCSC